MKKTTTNYIIAFLRIAMGTIFLWAFVDKLFGLSFATTPDKSWLSGGSPTYGFLKFGTHGPFKTFFESLAGIPFVDWVFMIGLLGLGLALLLGIGMRIAAYAGSLLLLLMWLATFPPENNPVIDDHIIYILVLILLYKTDAGGFFGFGQAWNKTKLVKDYPLLK